MPHRISLLLSALVLAPAAAHAQLVLTHSAYVLGADDAPVDGPLTVTFSLHDAATGGAQVWTSGGCSVTAARGYYAVTLGDGCGSGLTNVQLPATAPRWLETKIGLVTLEPRQLVAVQAAASLAADALKLGGALPAAFARVDAASTFTVAPSFAPASGAPFSVGGPTKVANLNADLLDGLDSAALARLDAASTFAAAPSFAPASGAPFSVGSSTKVTNLNADLLDGLDAAALVQTSGAQTVTGAKTFQNGGSSAVLNGGSLALTNGSVSISNGATGQGAVRVTSGQIAIEQATSEGDTRIYADYAPHFSWGIFHENVPNYLHFTKQGTTGVKTWTETGPNGSGGTTTSSTTSMFQFDLNTGDATFAGAMNAKYEGFEAWPNAAFSKAAGNWQKLTFDKINFNTLGSAYSTATSTFTAPRAGFWRCHLGGYSATGTSSADARYALGFNVSRGGGAWGNEGFSGGNYSSSDSPLTTHTQVMQLGVGDKVEAWMFSAIAASLPAGPGGGHTVRFGCEFAGR